ncbi:MAG: hemerythrin domain-containing protein [Candidatus Omnitrophota bacterium]|nr:hemerythrin domain-containing protein [Candidatus Omnitrophota bacterium]
MEKYLNTPIKEVITKFPKVADILNEYNIGCVPCNVGTCLLKDIVEIHNLSMEKEQELLARMAKVIYPGKDVRIPKIERKPPVKAEELSYSPPLKRLVDEHSLIKKWVGIIPRTIKNLDIASESDRQLILDGLDFIRFYADKFHHCKEEDILFEYADKNLDIIKTMLQDHETARGHVRAIQEALNKQDKDSLVQHLSAYKDLLTEHINKENEILYPWMDRNLSITEVGDLFTKFNQAESKLDKEVIERCKKFVQEAEERIQRLEAKKEVAK